MGPMRAPLCLLLAASAPLPALAELPPITSAAQAVGQLSSAAESDQRAALANLQAACRGKYRRELRDHPEVKRRLEALFAAAAPAVKRAVLDASRCYSSAAFLPLVVQALHDPDPGIIAYGAEVGARLEDPAVIAPLLEALSARAGACAQPGLSPAEVEVCVWLTYAPGAPLPAASAELKQQAAKAAVAMTESPYKKVREVAVETIAASGLAEHAPALRALIAREERKGGFSEPNDAALLARFKERLRALAKPK